MQLALLGLVALISAPPSYQLHGAVAGRVTAGAGTSPTVLDTIGRVQVYSNTWFDESIEPVLGTLIYAPRWSLGLDYQPTFTRRDYIQSDGVAAADLATEGQFRALHTAAVAATAYFPLNWRFRLRGMLSTGEATGMEAAQALGASVGNQSLGVGFYRFLSTRAAAGLGGDLSRRWLTYATAAFAHSEPLGDQRDQLVEIQANNELSTTLRFGYRLTLVDTIGLRGLYTRTDYLDRYVANSWEADVIYRHAFTRLSNISMAAGAALAGWDLATNARTPQAGHRSDQSVEPRVHVAYEGPLLHTRAHQVDFLARFGLSGYSDLTNYIFQTRAFADLQLAWVAPPSWGASLRLGAATPLQDPEQWTLAERRLAQRPIRAPESILRADLDTTYELHEYLDLLVSGRVLYQFTRFDRWNPTEFQYDDVTLEASIALRLNFETRPPSPSAGRTVTETGPGADTDIAAPLDDVGQGFDN